MLKSSSNTAYEKPAVFTWTAAALDGIEATLSGGGGGGFSPYYVAVYLLFSPIFIEDFDTSLDHTAFFLEKSDGSGLFYSFATDPDNGVAIVNGCNGRLSTCVDEDGVQLSITLPEIVGCDISDDDGNDSNFKSDLMKISNNPPYEIKGNNASYYRYLRIPIDNFSFHEQIGDDINDNALSIRSQNISDPRQYSLLWSNCCDCALECFRETRHPIDIGYDNAKAILLATGVAGAMLLSVNPLIAALGAALSASLLIEGVPTIPNLVYEGLTQVTVDGHAIDLGNPDDIKREYRSRSSK